MGVKLLGKIKIHEIAKEIGLTSKEVLDMAQKLNIDVKSHMSSVDESDAKKIESSLSEKTKQNTKQQNVVQKKEEKAPVIIRREVIISDEESNKKHEEKKQGTKNNSIGFVERKQNKDFNLVYRNKPNKPKTVNELFGLNKEEPKKEDNIPTFSEFKSTVSTLDAETRRKYIDELTQAKTPEEIGIKLADMTKAYMEVKDVDKKEEIEFKIFVEANGKKYIVIYNYR